MNLRLLSILLLAAPGAAFAQPYASVNLGWANADFPIEAPFNGLVDDSAPAYGIDVGMVFGSWGAELGWNSYGNFDGRAAPCAAGTVCVPLVTEESVSQDVYEIALIRQFTIRNFRFFGKAGYYHAKIDTDIQFDESDFSERGLLLGVGMRWAFDKPWNVSIEATRFDDNVSQFTVGVGWGTGFGKRTSDPYDDDSR